MYQERKLQMLKLNQEGMIDRDSNGSFCGVTLNSGIYRLLKFIPCHLHSCWKPEVVFGEEAPSNSQMLVSSGIKSRKLFADFGLSYRH